VDLHIELQIQRDRGYRIRSTNPSQDGSYPIDAVSMPVRNVNHSIDSYGNENEKQEILFLEIWTNGSFTPKEALYEASRNWIDFLISKYMRRRKTRIWRKRKTNLLDSNPFCLS
jgi:DNA-directed RNA polymerase subunit alpha